MKRRLAVTVLLLTLLLPVFGTNIKIPSLEIATWIYGYNGELLTLTQTQMDILVEGGYKFGGKIVMGFDGFIVAPDTGITMPPLTFKAVSLIARDIFGSPLDFSYFVGLNDYIGYGDDFTRYFGAPFIQSNYKSYYLIPVGTSLPPLFYPSLYKGIHRINGNGIKLEYFDPEQPFGFAWYLYQDHNFVALDAFEDPPGAPVINANIFTYDTGIYSSDLRFLINTEGFKAEIFLGGTLDSETLTGYARLGALLFMGLGPIDLLIVAGLPQLDFVSPFGLDLFYILFESRMNFGPVNITPTVFFHPSRYLQQNNYAQEANKIDFSVNLGIFNPRRDFISFGIESRLSTQNLFVGFPYYQLFALPYITLATPGVYWEFKLQVQVQDSFVPLTFQQMLSSMQGLINIRAEF